MPTTSSAIRATDSARHHQPLRLALTTASPLRFRDVEDLLAHRGITVPYESIRHWCQTFGLAYASAAPASGRVGRRHVASRRTLRDDSWPASILWRAVDQDGDVIDILLQSRRDRHAAARFFRKLLKRSGRVPRRLVTDRLGSYRAAQLALRQSFRQ